MEATEITAGRLHLRPWLERDLAELAQACQDRLIARWLSAPSPYRYWHAQNFLAQTSPRGWESGAAAHFAVLDASTGDLLAATTLDGLSGRRRCAEISFWTTPTARGRGVANEAVAAVCRWGFAVLDLHRILCLTEVGNLACQRTLRRAGFTYEGVARGALPAEEGRGRAQVISSNFSRTA